METAFQACAIIGGTVLILQTLLASLGIFHHGFDGTDTPGDHALEHDPSAAFFKLLSIKTAVAFLTFFGLGGLAATHAGIVAPLSLVCALGTGAAAFFFVGWLMVAMSRLQTQGNVDLWNAMGTTGRVYLRVPPRRSGRGKVTLAVQGRTVEVPAMTAGDELPTGSLVQIINVSADDLVEVVAATAKE